jgi:hypothetical protein
MSQTFRLAHQARGKLSFEASQQDHDLRLLVGHANLLDQLMLHLADADRQQQHWFEDSVRGNEVYERTQDDEEEDDREEDSEPVYGSLATDWPSDSDSESDDDEDYLEYQQNLTRVQVKEIYDIEEEDEDSLSDVPTDDDDDGLYSLTRTSSHRGGPPSLCSDLSEDEDDDHSAPPSPPQPAIHTPPVYKKSSSVPPMATGFFDDHHESPEDLHEENYFDVNYLPGPISTF